MKRSTLVIAPWLPLPADFGGALRTFHLINELAKTQHVLLIAPTHGDDREHLIALGEICDVVAVPAHWTPRQPPTVTKRLMQLRSLSQRRSFLEMATWDPRFQQVIDRLFLTRQIDFVQYELTQTALYRPTQPRPTLINAQNVEHELLQRVAKSSGSPIAQVLKFIEARKVRRLEQRLWRSADLCVATSARDAANIQRLSGSETAVVPNGVDTIAFARPHDGPRRKHHVVFTGVMRHEPNADAARWYIEQIHPRIRLEIPDASVAIVGGDPPASLTALSGDSVQVTGRVDDIRPWLWAAAAAIVPLRSGGGTRLKIVEAFAAETPVVSTTVGAEGIDIQDGEHLLLADTPEAFAARVVRLLREPALADRLTNNALAIARDRYDWSTIAGRLVDAQDRAQERFDATNHATDDSMPVDWAAKLWPRVR